jgi:hypothetical protein
LDRPIVAISVLTLLMGMTVAVFWMTFGLRAVQAGPLPVLEASWPLIYGSQVLLVGAVTLLVVHRSLRVVTPARLAMLVIGGWLGEMAVLTALGGVLLANEINPGNAWWFWWWATGGPIQPAAAFAGGLLGLRFRRVRPPSRDRRRCRAAQLPP